MFLEWNDIYSVNIKEIDSQHKNLFSLINKVQFSDKDKPNTKEEINKILDEMNDYAIYHFDTEEKYFKQFNYPKEEEHNGRHREYRDLVKKITEELNTKSIEENISEISNFLKKWWLGHIQNEDMQYSDFLNKNGLY